MPFFITKTSGEEEPFSIRKFRRSLRQAGAKPQLIDRIVKTVESKRPKSTKEIHAIATQILNKVSSPLAARYNLKKALIEFGPAGFPFEKFVAELFKKQGYKTELDQYLQGRCIKHEVDVIAHKGAEHLLIECKFHSRFGIKTDVKVPLYIRSRFEDINANPHSKKRYKNMWIVTNVEFTSEAIKYAKCVGSIKLLGWSYPKDRALPDLINKFELHPISALTILSKKQKHEFIQRGLVLCKDTPTHQHVLKELGFGPHKIKRIIQEAQAVCKLD